MGWPYQVHDKSRLRRERNGQSVAAYKASGPDADMATWTLGGADGSDFSISSSLELTFRSAPDYENATDAGNDNTYMVTVKASTMALTWTHRT